MFRILANSHCILDAILVNALQDLAVFLKNSLWITLLMVPVFGFLEVLEFFLTSVVSAVKDFDNLYIWIDVYLSIR